MDRNCPKKYAARQKCKRIGTMAKKTGETEGIDASTAQVDTHGQRSLRNLIPTGSQAVQMRQVRLLVGWVGLAVIWCGIMGMGGVWVRFANWGFGPEVGGVGVEAAEAGVLDADVAEVFPTDGGG